MAWRIHVAQEAWTAKVDAKAAIVLALEVAVLAAIIGASAAGAAFATLSTVGIIAVRSAGTLLTLAIIFAAASIFPLLGSPLEHVKEHRTNFIYFGHLRHWDSTRELSDQLEHVDNKDQLDQLARQLHRMSVGNWRKHRALQASISAGVVATVIVSITTFWSFA